MSTTVKGGTTTVMIDDDTEGAFGAGLETRSFLWMMGRVDTSMNDDTTTTIIIAIITIIITETIVRTAAVYWDYGGYRSASSGHAQDDIRLDNTMYQDSTTATNVRSGVNKSTRSVPYPGKEKT